MSKKTQLQVTFRKVGEGFDHEDRPLVYEVERLRFGQTKTYGPSIYEWKFRYIGAAHLNQVEMTAYGTTVAMRLRPSYLSKPDHLNGEGWYFASKGRLVQSGEDNRDFHYTVKEEYTG